MHRPSQNSSKRHTKNFASAAQTAYRHFDNAGSSFAKWMTTDHTGFSRSILDMPKMGFMDTCKHVVTTFLISMLGILGSAFIVYLMIAYGIPYFLFGSIS